MNLLLRSSLRYFAGHPWQVALSILGVTLGVAIVVAIDLANASARSSFERSAESVGGAATHHIVSGMEGFADSIYTRLRLKDGVLASAPIIESNITATPHRKHTSSNTSLAIPKQENQESKQENKRTLKLFGVDVFAERPFRPYLQNTQDARNFDLGPLISRNNTVLLSTETAQNLNVRVGDTLQCEIAGREYLAILCGTLTPTDEASKRALQDIMVCDIGTAQHFLQMQGRLSRIDLILTPTNEAQEIQRITAMLPKGLEIIRSEARPKRIADMARAFELNLTALSLLALMVGIFIIYNTMTFSVVQRRQFLGMIRVVGVTRREVFAIVLIESVFIGLCGTAGGLALGILLGRGLVILVAQTINDLYFTVNVTSLDISPFVLAKGAVMGFTASLFAAFAPAREAMMSPPRTVLSRSASETSAQANVKRFTILGACLLLVGIAILFIPSRSIYVGYAGLLPILLGFALFVPVAATLIITLLHPILQRTSGVMGTMAARGVVRSLSRTGVAIAALMVAVAATIGVGIMVTSFRQTVVEWLTYTLSADIYISPPSLIARRNDNAIDSALVRRIIARPEVSGYTTFRTFLAETVPLSMKQSSDSERLAQIITTNYSPYTKQRFHFKKAEQSTVWEAFQQGDALVSEAFAFHNGVDVGETIRLKTDKGVQSFRIAGIYYEYASDVGIVFLERRTYERLWDNHTISGLSLFLKPDVKHDEFIQSVQQATSGVQTLSVRSNSTLLQTSLAIFDRTFAITDVLRLLTIMVSFVGVLSALMALQLEKAREIGVLRANGVTPRQVWILTLLQTGIIGAVAGVLAIPLGLVLAYVLIFVINQRSFGWTLQFYASPEILLQALALAMLAALLAGVYPAWKTSKTSPALALREE